MLIENPPESRIDCGETGAPGCEVFATGSFLPPSLIELSPVALLPRGSLRFESLPIGFPLVPFTVG